jgi:hypothetical protein
MSYTLRPVLWCDYPDCGRGHSTHGRKGKTVEQVREMASRVGWVYVPGKVGPFEPQDRIGDVEYWPPMDLCRTHALLDPAKIRDKIVGQKEAMMRRP